MTPAPILQIQTKGQADRSLVVAKLISMGYHDKTLNDPNMLSLFCGKEHKAISFTHVIIRPRKIFNLVSNPVQGIPDMTIESFMDTVAYNEC